MFSLIISLMFWVLATVAYANSTFGDVPTAYDLAAVLFAAAAAVSTVICICTHVENYNNQIDDIENIRRYEEEKVIALRRADTLIHEFKFYLANRYPEYEEKVLSLIRDGKAGDLVTVFPEPKVLEGFEGLIEQIGKLRGESYKKDENIVYCKKRIRVRKRNPFILTFFLPTYEEVSK